MPTITLSDGTYAKVKAHAEPLVDSADSVISRIFDFYATHNAANGLGVSQSQSTKPSIVTLAVGSRELTHTRLLTATVDGVQLYRPDWNSLARDLHVMAKKRLGSFDVVRAATSANLRQDRFEENGFRYLPEAEFSIQGCDANNSCECAFRLAKAMRISLRVTFEWRERNDAAYPGQTGVIEWKWQDHRDDHDAHEGSKSWHEATKPAIRRIASGRPTRIFTLAELTERELARIVRDTGSQGATPDRTLQRVCQELRDEGFIDFLDNNGTYRLR